MRNVILGLCLAAMLAACSSSSGGGTGGSGGSGGRGGTSGTGGTGGTSGTGGSGGAGGGQPDAHAGDGPSATPDAGPATHDTATAEAAPAAADCFPECIAKLRRSCQRPVTGSCMHDSRNNVDAYCYSNGVKEVHQDPPVVSRAVVTFTGPGGAPCYSTVVVSDPGVVPIQIAFKDPGGREVARGSHGIADGKWSITCDGSTFMVDEFSKACDTVVPGQCTDGFCQ